MDRAEREESRWGGGGRGPVGRAKSRTSPGRGRTGRFVLHCAMSIRGSMSWASMGVPTPSMGRSVEAPPIATRVDGVSGRMRARPSREGRKKPRELSQGE